MIKKPLQNPKLNEYGEEQFGLRTKFIEYQNVMDSGPLIQRMVAQVPYL